MRKQLHTCLMACFIAIVPSGLFAQNTGDDLSKLLDEAVTNQDEIQYATASFKTTRLINGHSSEQVHAGVLDMRISHRFGFVNGGTYTFFGLDNATMRMALEYGAFPWLTVGLGRSTYEKTYDGFLKARIARQASGKRAFPITLNYMSSMAIKTIKFADPNKVNYKTSNYYYTHQLILARKFSDAFSFLVAPTLDTEIWFKKQPTTTICFPLEWAVALNSPNASALMPNTITNLINQMEPAIAFHLVLISKPVDTYSS